MCLKFLTGTRARGDASEDRGVSNSEFLCDSISPEAPRGGWDKEPAGTWEARWLTGGKLGEHRENAGRRMIHE